MLNNRDLNTNKRDDHFCHNIMCNKDDILRRVSVIWWKQSPFKGAVTSWMKMMGVEIRACVFASYRFLNDIEALLIDLKRSHLLNDLLQEDVLFVIITLD